MVYEMENYREWLWSFLRIAIKLTEDSSFWEKLEPLEI